MSKFNVAGPCIPDKHYMLDPMRGIGDELMDLIDEELYFVIHAARQSGKTTLLKALARQINKQGEYHALYCSLEAIDGFNEPKDGIPEIVKSIESCVRDHGLPEGFAKNIDYSHISGVLKSSLVAYCRSLDKPLVLFFDEVDCLRDGTLISFLRQLRDGYINRPDIPFVQSVALVGMRNLRDYKEQIRSESKTLGSASPFNIVTKTFNLRNFTKAEVAELYAQHSSKTGQVFEPQAVDYAFEQTQGQPWLVNAMAREAVEEITRKDYSIPITQSLADQAIQNIILERGTHFDSLMKRLNEERVRNIVIPLIAGDNIADRDSDDYLYTRDLGLIRETADGFVEPANQIYAEIMVRRLSGMLQNELRTERPNDNLPKYIVNGKIDVDTLLREFQIFWRENSEIWVERYKPHNYRFAESAPHLVFQAFLQRVINGGAQVLREMAAGKKRADLCIIHNGHKYPIELKILQNQKSRAESLNQISEYMDKVGADTGWLVMFDRDDKKSWDDKIYMKKEAVGGKEITVAGC